MHSPLWFPSRPRIPSASSAQVNSTHTLNTVIHRRNKTGLTPVLLTFLQLWPTCLKISGERSSDSRRRGRRGTNRLRLMRWLPLEGAYATHMLFFGSSKWRGEPACFWFLNWCFACGCLQESGLCIRWLLYRRRQLAQLGSATGVYKTLVKYLVGVPQVGLPISTFSGKDFSCLLITIYRLFFMVNFLILIRE